MPDFTGTIERITYYNGETGYSVLKLKPSDRIARDQIDREGLVTVVGVMSELMEGETVKFSGDWIDDKTYGRQFKAAGFVPQAPQSEKGIQRYLVDAVLGIGPSTAKRIYDAFGVETISILETDPDRLHELGLKTKIIDNVREALQRNRAERLIMVDLQNYGITPTLARKIFAQYGEFIGQPQHLLTALPTEMPTPTPIHLPETTEV